MKKLTHWEILKGPPLLGLLGFIAVIVLLYAILWLISPPEAPNLLWV